MEGSHLEQPDPEIGGELWAGRRLVKGLEAPGELYEGSCVGIEAPKRSLSLERGSEPVYAALR